MKKRMIDFLLANADPSIRLRIKEEILHDITDEERRKFQEQILLEPKIPPIKNAQKENGWIGNGFHGGNKIGGPYDNQEVGTKYLGEKGLKGTDVLDRAMDAYETTELTDPCYGTKGKYYSEFEIAAFGWNMVRCACIARAHYDDVIDITPQIEVALESFKRVTEVDSIFDVSRPVKGGRLFNDNEKWPCRYHLEILAFTDSWKSNENVAMLTDSFNRLMRKDRTEYIDIEINCWVGHKVGPLWRLTEGYSLMTGPYNHKQISDGIRRVNIEKIEWMVRCGLYKNVPELKEEVDRISNSINTGGICEVEIYENEFKEWGPYGGLQLETDWRSKIRKACDITFRALLVLHYSDLQD